MTLDTPSIASTVVRRLGRVAFEPTWQAMRAFNQARGPGTPDEIWLLQHEPVFTLGLAGRPEHVLDPGPVPVIHCDRGGQVTYHGPGQIVAYALFDLRRMSLGVKALVRRLEQAAIDVLAQYAVQGGRREGMPGVYVDGAKIAAVGLRIANGCCYHGLSLNVDLDLSPYRRIDPCGHPGLAVTRLADHGVRDSIDAVQQKLLDALQKCLKPT